MGTNGRSWLLPLLAAAGLVAAGFQAGAQALAEPSHRPVLLVADQPAFQALAEAHDVSAVQLLRQAARAGVGALAVPEDTLRTLAARPGSGVELVSGAAWRDAARAGELPAAPFPLAAEDTYVFVSRPGLAAWLRQALPATLGPGVAVRWRRLGALAVADIGADETMVADAPLGFAPGAFAVARAVGLPVVPRLQDPFTGLGARALADLYASPVRAGVRVAAVVFAGPAWLPIPGGPGRAATTAAILRARGWPLGVVEQPGGGDLMPPGLARLAQALPGRVTRVQSVSALATFTPVETRRLAQQAAAGNVGLLYLRPVVGGGNPDHLTIAYLRSLAEALRAEGLTPSGAPWTPPPLRGRPWAAALEAVGAVAGFLWLWRLAAPRAGGSAAATALGAALAAGLAAAGSRAAGAVADLAQLTAYGLSALWVLRVAGPLPPRSGASAGAPAPRADAWPRTGAAMLGWAGLGAAGGLYAAGPFASTANVLGWAGYAGGAAMRELAVPLVALLFASAGLAAGAWPAAARRLEEWGDRPLLAGATLRVGHVVVAALVLAVLYLLHRHALSLWVYRVRAPWQVATQSRWAVPPSEAAVLLGFPAVAVAVWCGRRGHRAALLVALALAAVGQAPLAAALSTGGVSLRLGAASLAWMAVLGAAAGALALACCLGAEAALRALRLAASRPPWVLGAEPACATAGPAAPEGALRRPLPRPGAGAPGPLVVPPAASGPAGSRRSPARPAGRLTGGDAR